jgi:hypothetical protein
MQNMTTEQRRMIGCGFEPAHPAAVTWSPPIGGKGYAHGKPTVCVGYTTNLPEVNETSLARLHWSKGAVDAYAQGEPSEALLDSIVILEGAEAHCSSYWMTPKEEGGGRS